MTNKPSIDFTDPEIVIPEFGTFNVKDSREFVANGTIIDGENMALERPIGDTANNYLSTRLGYSLFNSGTIPVDKVQGHKIYKKTSESFYRSVKVIAGNVYEARFTNIYTFTQDYTLIASAEFDKLAKINIVQFNDKLYFADGVNSLTSYDGTTFTRITSGVLGADSAVPSIVIVHANRVWVNNNKVGTVQTGDNTGVDYRFLLYASELNNGDAWVADPTANPSHDAVVQPFQGLTKEVSPITGVGVYTGSIAVHQAGRVFLFITNGSPYNADGSVTWYIKELVIDRGAVSHGTIADLGESNIYLTTRGVHELSGMQALQSATTTIDTINAKPLSYEIEPLLFKTDWTNAVATFFKFYYILTVQSAGIRHNNMAFVYDTRRKKWYTPWTNYNFSCFEVAKINNEEYCFAGSSTDGSIYTLFTSDKDEGVVGGVMSISSTPYAGGAGYVVGDVLTISSGSADATVEVLTVSSGEVTSVSLLSGGTSDYVAGAAISTTGGTGTGCKINVTGTYAPIYSWFMLNYMNFGKPDHTKTFRRMSFWPKTVRGGVYTSYSIDFGQIINISVEYGATNRASPLGQFILGTDILGQQQKLNRPFSLAFRGRRGRNISFIFSNNNAAGTGSKGPFAIECVRIKAYIEDEDKRENL